MTVIILSIDKNGLHLTVKLSSFQTKISNAFKCRLHKCLGSQSLSWGVSLFSYHTPKAPFSHEYHWVNLERYPHPFRIHLPLIFECRNFQLGVMASNGNLCLRGLTCATFVKYSEHELVYFVSKQDECCAMKFLNRHRPRHPFHYIQQLFLTHDTAVC